MNVGLSEAFFSSYDIHNFALSNGLEWMFSERMSTSGKIIVGKNRSNEYTPSFSFSQYELNLNGYLFRKDSRLNLKLGAGLNYFRANGQTVWLISIEDNERTFSYKDINSNTVGVNLDLAITYQITDRLELNSSVYAIPYFENSIYAGFEISLLTKLF